MLGKSVALQLKCQAAAGQPVKVSYGSLRYRAFGGGEGWRYPVLGSLGLPPFCNGIGPTGFAQVLPLVVQCRYLEDRIEDESIRLGYRRVQVLLRRKGCPARDISAIRLKHNFR